MTPQTWHHGLIAEWWAAMNVDGPEIEAYRPYVEAGQPALDAGCGAGRLLVPWRRAGLDVDGCDASRDMIARCRDRLSTEGLDATLWAHPSTRSSHRAATGRSSCAASSASAARGRRT